jgi:hypothetical protein
MFDLKKGLAAAGLLAALCLAPSAQAGGWHHGYPGHGGYGYNGGYAYNGFGNGRFCNRPGFGPYGGGFRNNFYAPRYNGGYGYGNPYYAPRFQGPRFGGFYNRPGARVYYGF